MARTLAAIPAFNEEVAIGSVVLKARQYVDEVLVIDDGSRDGTASVAKMAMATVISHRQNLGKGATIRTAFDYARRNGHEVVVLIDGDGQHDCDDIPSVAGPVLNSTADIALGMRSGENSGMPLYRRAGKRMLDYTTALFTGFLTDTQCGFRAFSRRAIDVLDPYSPGFGVESEIIIQAKEGGLRLVEVPISSRYDVEGSTLAPVTHGYRVVDSILHVIAERHPLFFFGIPGFALALISVLLGAHALQVYDQTGALALSYALPVVFLFIVGSLLMLTAIILNVLPKAMVKRLNSRPVSP